MGRGGGVGCRILGSQDFQGERRGEFVVANKVKRGDYRELTANKGYHQNNTEFTGGGGEGVAGFRGSEDFQGE